MDEAARHKNPTGSFLPVVEMEEVPPPAPRLVLVHQGVHPYRPRPWCCAIPTADIHVQEAREVGQRQLLCPDKFRPVAQL